MKAWTKFVGIQLLSLTLTVIGWVLLLVLAFLESATVDYDRSKRYPYKIYRWRWEWINYFWGNEEDGIDGSRGYRRDVNDILYQYAWLKESDGWPFYWRIYRWSAVRNSCNNLRFLFSPENVFHRWYFFRRTFYLQAGWYSNGSIVLSIGRVGPELPDEANRP